MAAGTAYTKRYAGGFVDGSGGGTPIDSVFLNAVETALLQLIGAAPTADGQVMQWDNANTHFGPALLLNKNIDPAAAIAKSKLDFTGGNGIVNADIAGAAAIAYTKLNLASSIVSGDIVDGTIVDADLNAAAAIQASKIASSPWAFRVAGSYDLNTSTTESSLISGAASSGTTGWQIPANKLGANGAVRVTLIGDYLNNSGGAVNLTLKVKFGGSTFWGDIESVAAGATRRNMFIQFVLGNTGATNSNFLSGSVLQGDGVAGSVAGIGHTGGANWGFGSAGALAIDTTVAQYIDITALHGTSSASVSFRRFFATLEYLI